MSRLREMTKVLRSKNAGPFQITFDLLFRDATDLDRVVGSGILSLERIAMLTKAAPETIEVYVYRPASAIKITIPRQYPSGAFDDSDVFGCQQHAWLLDLEVPAMR